MTVKTPFTDHDFRAILARYSLGDLRSFSPLAGGTVQTNYLLQTAAGRFVFRYYENRSIDSVRFECNLVRSLRGKHYPCPDVYANKTGRRVGVYTGKPYAIFEYIQGEHLQNPTPAQQRQLIHRVAELQNLTRAYRPRGWQQRWNYTPALCWELAQNAAGGTPTPNARQKLRWFRQALDGLRLPRNLPKGICHCDFHFSNILFDQGEFAALIDFDDANYTYLTYDLATLIDPFIPSFTWETWSRFERGADVLHFGAARRVAAEYAGVRPLRANERRHLFDVFKLSVLFDCVWYFARGDADDFYERRKIEALDHLGRERFTAEVFP